MGGGNAVHWLFCVYRAPIRASHFLDMTLIWREATGPLVYCWLDTSVGTLRLSARGDALVSIDWDDAGEDGSSPTPVLQQASEALRHYFHSPDAPAAAVPLHPSGTAYQRRVWERLAAIPPGQVASYGRLARELGSGARAVASACRANPYPLLVPCHRVVAAHGLGGYCGANDGHWLENKRYLLAHEQGAGLGRGA